VDFLIFFTNKNFLSIFWLEIWWDGVRHPKNAFSAALVGFVGTDGQKSGLNLVASWHSNSGPDQENHTIRIM